MNVEGTEAWRAYSRRAEYATRPNASAISTCHSHQEACQLRATAIATIASARRMNATPIAATSSARRRR